LNPGLPNDTPALYPLLHELMLKKRCKVTMARFKLPKGLEKLRTCFEIESGRGYRITVFK
jgi:hypothetical protein